MILLWLLTLSLLLPVPSWAAEVAADNFDRADGGLGANWTTVGAFTAPAIVSNLVQPGILGGSGSLAVRTAEPFGSDQYVQMTITTLATASNRIAGVIMRNANPANRTNYECQALGPLGSTTTLTIYRFNAGAPTVLATTGAAATVASGDILYCEVVGSTVTLKINGVTKVGPIVDGSPIASGKPGIVAYSFAGATSNVQLNDWSAGDFTSDPVGLTAASCSAADINASIGVAVDGDTVNIPPCTETELTEQITIPSTKGIILLGAGEGVTNLKYAAGATNTPIKVNVRASNTMTRISGFTFNAAETLISNFIAIYLVGTGIDKFRLDHVTVMNVKSGRAVKVDPSDNTLEISGLIDHVTCTVTGAIQCFNIHGPTGAWTFGHNPGTNHMVHIEDSTCNYPVGAIADACIDSTVGYGNVAFRYNTINHIGLGFHGVDSSPRGPHLIELYRNKFAKPSGSNTRMSNFRSGPDLMFDNVATGSYTAGSIALEIYRARTDQSNYGAAGGPCNGLNAWDGNEIANGALGEGYPCLDQVGWYFPNTANGATAVQRPAYLFNNTINGTDTAAAPSVFAGSTKLQTDYMHNNVDYYGTVGAACSGGSCTTGVGRGTLAARPASCTTGVGYWATDQGGNWNTSTTDAAFNPSGAAGEDGALYKCTATNTWTLYYTPYTYPHPLQGAAPAVPDAPTGLAILGTSTSTTCMVHWPENDLANLVGYHLYYGTTSGVYTKSITKTAALSAAAHQPVRQHSFVFPIAGTYYITVTAYSDTVADSAAATEVTCTSTGVSRGQAATRAPRQ